MSLLYIILHSSHLNVNKISSHMSVFYNCNKVVNFILLKLHMFSPLFSYYFFKTSLLFYILLYIFTFFLYNVKKKDTKEARP